jgi:hypothetical protein
MSFSRYLLPLQRLSPIYPGQLGVDGSDVPRGVQSVPGRKCFYVDHDHPDASDAHDGVDPEHPKLTIQAAVDSPWLEAGDTIVVGPATPTPPHILNILAPSYAENVVVSNDRPAFVSLMGCGTSRFHVVWNRDLTKANTLPLLDLRQAGWTVSGFKFHAPPLGASVLLNDWIGPPPPAPPTDSSLYTIIEGNLFDGAWSGLYGILMYGIGDRVIIKDNWFLEHNANAGATAIKGILPGMQDPPYECILEGNIFMENANHVVLPLLLCSLVRGNVFFTGNLVPFTLALDLTGGGSNIVTGNVLQGTYSHAGGYVDGAGDLWANNTIAAGWTTIGPA